jgi:hypothetical protein
VDGAHRQFLGKGMPQKDDREIGGEHSTRSADHNAMPAARRIMHQASE